MLLLPTHTLFSHSVINLVHACLVCIFTFIVSTFAVQQGRQSNLAVSIYEVKESSVVLNWQSRVLTPSTISICELVYGPVDQLDQVEVLPNFVPRGHVFELKGLATNISYHFHIVCYSTNGTKYESNHLQFTPGSYQPPVSTRPSSSSSLSNYIASLDPYHSSHDIVSRESAYYDEKKYLRSVRSSSVVLGAFCGIVGFLIINVTVVMAVKRYSHLQLRRQRILEIEDVDFGEVAHIREYD